MKRWIFSIRWNALATLASPDNVLHLATDIANISFDIPLSGTVTRNLTTPTLTDVALLYDSGNSSTDKITYNPSVTGAISGELAGGMVRVEFDHENDGSVDGYTYTESDGTFRYLPTLIPGRYTIHARSSSLNTHTTSGCPAIGRPVH